MQAGLISGWRYSLNDYARSPRFSEKRGRLYWDNLASHARTVLSSVMRWSDQL